MPLAPINPFVNNNNFRSANQTNLDVENPQSLGGPNSFPQYNHNHQYSPSNTYLNTHQEEASPNSDFGTTGVNINPGRNIFKNDTSLDIENPGPGNLGGPNRTNSSNIAGGIYNIPKSGTTFGNSPGGPLKNLDGEIKKYQLHHYLNKDGQRYLDQNLNPLPPPPENTRFLDNIFDNVMIDDWFRLQTG